MTEKMSNALAHIQNAQDVDDWAKNIVAERFVAYDALLLMMHNLRNNIKDDGERSAGFNEGLELAMALLVEVMK